MSSLNNKFLQCDVVDDIPCDLFKNKRRKKSTKSQVQNHKKYLLNKQCLSRSGLTKRFYFFNGFIFSINPNEWPYEILQKLFLRNSLRNVSVKILARKLVIVRIILHVSHNFFAICLEAQ